MKNVVHRCDCMDFMAGVPDNSYNLGVVDPPYGVGWDGENLSMSKGLRKDGTIRNDKSWRAKKYTQKYEKKGWDNKIPDKIYFTELFRISKYQIIWGGNYFHDFLKPTGGWIIWDKMKPLDFSLSQGEMAWTNCKNSLKIFGYLWHGYAQKNIKNKEKRIHPTQKPIALYKWLLQNYAKPGQTIFDSHVGSGSIRIACHDMGFEFEGCEIDPDYHAAQEKRFQDHIARGQELWTVDEHQDIIYEQGAL